MRLTDEELIDRVIKFSDDPEKIQLATYMERIKGAIIDDLIDAGMDNTYCTFTTEWGSDRLPGQYITHLEEEIQLRDNTIAELKQEIKTAKYVADEARAEQDRAEKDRSIMKDKLSMWAKLNGQV